MSASGFTPGQRRTVLLLIVAVIMVFAMLAGFIATSLKSWERSSPVPTPASTSAVSTPFPTPSPFPSPVVEEGILSQVQAARLFEQIAHQVETMRGLSPRAEVPLSFLDQRQMTGLLRELYAERVPEERWLSYVVLGMLPDASVLPRVHQVAGVYVPEQEQLYIATGGQQGDTDDQALLAHAYARALQDQRFDLEAMQARATTTDATLAIQALVEGDAILLTALYHYGSVALADRERLVELISQARQPDYGPELGRSEVWARLQHFPYWEGFQFVDALFQIGGWDAVNQAYTNPPRSTEQVLHPKRYLERTDPPTTVVVPDVGVVLDERWDILVRDTLGEFAVGLYLGTLLPSDTAWQAADGWDGDTFVAWEHSDGSWVLVWRTIWDSNDDAVEFERALTGLVIQRYLPARPVDPPDGLPGAWWESDLGAVCVARAARHVIFVQAPDVNTLANVMELLP